MPERRLGSYPREPLPGKERQTDMHRTVLLLLALGLVSCTEVTQTPDRIPADQPAPTVAESEATLTLDLLNMRSDEQVVRFLVHLDGELLVDQRMPYADNPVVERLPLHLDSGDHELRVSVGDHSVTETVTVPEDNAVFLSAAYWGPAQEGMEAPPIELTLSEEPFGYA